MNNYKDTKTKFEPAYKSKDKEKHVPIFDNVNLDSLIGRVKFLFLFFFIGVGFILAGDLLKYITLRSSGIACIILGWVIIVLGVIIPLISWIKEQE